VTATDAVAEGLRERKKAKTRQALEDAALDLFARQGFDRTTVEQIADACDVSPRTFFRYFPTKEDVLFGDATEKLQLLVGALEQRPQGEPPLRSLRAALLAIATTYEEERPLRKVRAEIVAATPMLRARGAERQDDWNDVAVEVLLRRNEQAGAPIDPFAVRLAVAASSAAARAAFATWLDEEHSELRTLLERGFDQLAAGLDT
jgi:AcrR family transcriptional regulator